LLLEGKYMVGRKSLLLSIVVVVVMIASVMLLAVPSRAAGGSHDKVIVTGLDNPRGLDFGPDGALYIAEAGRGGDGPCIAGPEGGEVCYGPTGAVTRIDDDGEQEQVATGLPSVAGEGGRRAAGPHHISVLGRHAFLTIGLGADPAERENLGEAGPDFGQLAKITAGGQIRNIADIAAFETEANPDADLVDSNPYGVLAQPGKRIVVDAGGNSLLQVDDSGTISTLAIFPDRMVDAPSFLDLPPGTEIPMQAVPTSVDVGPDGAYYVGQLTGFPFVVGAANVFRVVPGQDPEVYLEGFTHIIDLEFDEKGNLYVLQIASVSLLEGDTQTGTLIRVKPDGERQTLLDNLTMPGGIAAGEDGDAIYISDCGVCAREGKVIRLELN
jgi:hypothetical protein